MDAQQLQTIIEQRDLALWQDHATAETLSGLSLQEYQDICALCVQTDWGQGMAHLWQESQSCTHSWYWEAPNGHQNAGNAFFRACQQAKVQCVRELAQHMKLPTLIHAVLLGSHNNVRPLKMTQNRVKSLGYIAREMKKYPTEHLSQNEVFIQSVLGNEHLGVIRSFHDVWDKHAVWSKVWSKLEARYIQDGVVLPNPGAKIWTDALELLWQVTESQDEIPEGIRLSLMEIATHPQNMERFPYIHSELTKKEISEAISEHQSLQSLRRQKKM